MEEIFINLLSTTTMITILGFILKKIFEKSLDNKIKLIQVDYQEKLKKQFNIYNQNFDTLKTATSLVYRARNTARDIHKYIISSKEIEEKIKKKFLKTLNSYHTTFEELLFDERSVIPEELFKHLHDLKHAIAFFVTISEHISNNEQDNKYKKRLEDAFTRLDAQYEALIITAKQYMEIKD